METEIAGLSGRSGLANIPKPVGPFYGDASWPRNLSGYTSQDVFFY